MEVLVAMTLMGMCVAILLSMVADHLRITWKLAERNEKVLYAINKTEEACLGILGDGFEGVEGKKIWRGKTPKGLPWKVVEQTSEEGDETLFYDVSLAGLYLQGVRTQKQSKNPPQQ